MGVGTVVSSFHRCEYRESRCLGPSSRTTLGKCKDRGEALKKGIEMMCMVTQNQVLEASSTWAIPEDQLLLLGKREAFSNMCIRPKGSFRSTRIDRRGGEYAGTFHNQYYLSKRMTFGEF